MKELDEIILQVVDEINESIATVQVICDKVQEKAGEKYNVSSIKRRVRKLAEWGKLERESLGTYKVPDTPIRRTKKLTDF